jgi:hypothetical protein
MFELTEGKVTIHPDQLAIPEFKKIWDMDKSKSKDKAFEELSYVFFTSDITDKNPYHSYPEDKRIELVKKDILKNENWGESKEVLLAREVYKKLTMTQTMELLDSAKGVINKLKGYFDSVDFTKKNIDKFGNETPEYDAKEVISSLSNLGKIVESINQLEEKVRKEITTSSKRRGGSSTALFED